MGFNIGKGGVFKIMCGLAGIFIGSVPGRNTLETIKNQFVLNLLANEERGREATGIAVLKRDGTFFIEKAPVRASQFVLKRAFADIMEKRIDEDVTAILGHTRRPTRGSPADNNNNHPIVVGNTIGIHNGTITNDDEIFLAGADESPVNKKRRRIGSVDSEAIFTVMDEAESGESLETYAQGIKQAASALVGSYTTLFVNRTLPDKLFLLKYDNPISVHYSKSMNSLFFSSRYVFLRKTFGKSVITEALPSKTGYIFDASVLITRGKRPLLQFGLE